ncbi:MAG TPA: GNAT family N-acetyltransferase [Oculatellaceae cyanobacterium]
MVTSEKIRHLEIRRFTQAQSPDDFERAIQLRLDVFVTEQHGPPEDEPDEWDENAMHWLLVNAENGAVLATGRVFAYQETCQMRPVAKIGRIAVCKDARGLGLGLRVMQEILDYIREEGYEQAILDAQVYALAFYEKLGFVPEGYEFDEGGIPHKRMRLLFR